MDAAVVELVNVFAEEVPEIADGQIEIVAAARMPGIRSKLALRSLVTGMDALAVCLGTHACHIRADRILQRLGGEGIEAILWNDVPEVLIAKALVPARIRQVILDPARHRATVIVDADQLHLVSGDDQGDSVFGAGNVNRELASRLCGWQIDVRTSGDGPVSLNL